MIRINSRALVLGLLVSGASGLAGEDVLLDPPLELQTGHVPEAVEAKDLDGDGHLDLVILNTSADDGPGGDQLSIFLGRGDGTFLAKGSVATERRPEALVVDKLNGDDSYDLAVSNFNANTITVMLGNGDGTFAPPIETQAQGGPRHVLAADVNGDGKKDLVVSLFHIDSVAIYLGSGLGSYLLRQTLAVGDAPEMTTAGNLTADEDLDLVSADTLSDTITPLRNIGGGAFEVGPAYPVGEQPRFLKIFDFDKDGLGDVIVANNDSHQVTIERNLGNLTFERAAELRFARGTILFEAPLNLEIADIDGDSRQDILTTWSRTNLLSVFRGTDDPFVFAPPDAFETSVTPVGLVAADFNEDGSPDVAVTNALDDTCWVYNSFAPSASLILDDGKPGTEVIGTWLSSDSPFVFGGESIFGRSGARHRWNVELAAPGLYEVLIRWGVSSTRATAVPVHIVHKDGRTARFLDQTKGIGNWHSLGIYSFEDLATVSMIAPLADGSASADAVRLRGPLTGADSDLGPILSLSPVSKPADIAMGGNTFLALRSTLTSLSSAESARIESLVLASAGPGSEPARIASVSLYDDVDGDGRVSAADRLLAEPLPIPDEPRVLIFSNLDLTLAAGARSTLLVACDLLEKDGPSDLRLEIVSILGAGVDTGKPVTVSGLPLEGWLFPDSVQRGIQQYGDSNQDGDVNISDGIFFLLYLFASGSPLPCGDGTLEAEGNRALMDLNGDTGSNLSDAIFLFQYLFLGGAPPVAGIGCRPIIGCVSNPSCPQF